MSTAAILPSSLVPTPVHHTFFYKLLHEVEVLFHKAPSWTESANAVLQYAIPAVQLVIDLDLPALAPVLDPILSRVKVGVATLSLMARQGGTHPTLLSIVQALRTNVTDLEAVARIDNPETQAKISANLALLESELAAFETTLAPAPTGTTLPSLQASGAVKSKRPHPGKRCRTQRSTTVK